MSKMNFVTIPIDFVETSTKNAILISKDGENFWIPRSTLSMDYDTNIEVDAFELILESIEVDEWFAKKTGWN